MPLDRGLARAVEVGRAEPPRTRARRAGLVAARVGAAIAGVLVGPAALLAGIALVPAASPSLAAHPAPAATPAAARRLVAAFDASERGIRLECRSRLIGPGAGVAPSGRAVVLMHG